MYLWWIIIVLFLFLKDEVFFLILSLLFFILLKVRPKDPFAILPLPFSLILLNLFLKLDIIYLKERV